MPMSTRKSNRGFVTWKGSVEDVKTSTKPSNGGLDEHQTPEEVKGRQIIEYK